MMNSSARALIIAFVYIFLPACFTSYLALMARENHAGSCLSKFFGAQLGQVQQR